MPDPRHSIGLVLGSGCRDEIDGLPADAIDTDYGAPSSHLYRRDVNGRNVYLLLRHGENHDIPPHAINYRANIAALHAVGASSIIALNTVGVITAIAACGSVALPRQLVDYTWGREHTFATGGVADVRHIEFTDPFSETLRQGLHRAAASTGVDCVDGGVYAVTQGPRLETAAEVDRLERDGADFVGMTAMPEAALAAELDIDYAVIALVVNPAAGRGPGSIHAEVAVNSAAALAAAMRIVDAYLGVSA